VQPEVSILVSDDNGASWREIATNIPTSQGTYMWTAEAPGTQYLMRVQSGPTFDVSDATFSIVRALDPTITVLYPNGGENLTVGTMVDVRWNALDITGDVDIEYSVDNGNSWTMAGTAPAAAGTYSWMVPDMVTEDGLIRVSGSGVSDVSNGTFDISHQLIAQITVLSPNSGTEIWRRGQMVNIDWTAQVVAQVDILLSTDNGANWNQTIATGVDATAGTYQWTVPDLGGRGHNQLVLKIQASGSGDPSDQSDNPFGYQPGVGGVTGAVVGEGGLTLLGNFPNPFAGLTEVRWLQPRSAEVELRVYRQNGELVRAQRAGVREAGEQRVLLDGTGLANGAYIYELRSGAAVVRGTLVVLR
jgi:hypothetical protein